MSSGTSYEGEGIELKPGYCKFDWSKFYVGKTLTVAGNVHDDPKRLTINFKDVHGNVALQFDTRFDVDEENRDIMCFNNCYNGDWGCEERIYGIPYEAGQIAYFEFKAECDGISISANEKENFLKFPYRDVPAIDIAFVEIDGDLTVYNIRLQES